MFVIRSFSIQKHLVTHEDKEADLLLKKIIGTLDESHHILHHRMIPLM